MNKQKKNKWEVCGIGASYNYENLKWGRFCKVHSLENMDNVRSRRCIYDNCKKQPIFNYPNEENIILWFMYCRTYGWY